MKDWQTRREFYAQQGRLEDQKHEDMLAGRILRGLGFKVPAKTIYKVERAVLGVPRGERPLWLRARDIFAQLLECKYPKFGMPMRLEALCVRDWRGAYEHTTVVDWKRTNCRPVLFVRIKGTEHCYVYTFWTWEELSAYVKPPFTVHATEEYPAWLFTQQEAAHFVEQLGPYDINVVMQEFN